MTRHLPRSGRWLTIVLLLSPVAARGQEMTMDLFEYTKDDMIEGPVLGGAATYIETATKSDINLFI